MSTSSELMSRKGQRQERHNHSNIGRHQHSDLGLQRFGRMYPCMVAFSILVYWTTVSIIPVYNKFFFQKSMYPYPIATAGIQLGVVSLLLAVLNTLHHYFWQWKETRRYGSYDLYYKQMASTLSNNSISSSATTKIDSYDDDLQSTVSQLQLHQLQRSWIFGPHFWWKVKWCFPIGCLFGLKYGATNLGLHLVPAPTHLLLQATDLVWTVLGAWYINGEIVSAVEMLCLAGCVAGSVVLSWQIEELSSVAAPFYAICINLISPVFLGLCLATLRLACTELMRPDNRVGGTVSSVELTSIKLIVSSAVGLLLACILEGGDENRPSWWAAFGHLAASTRWGVLCGSLLISVFQVNCTFLTFLTSAVALGLVGQVKIIPQWFLAALTASRTSNFTMHAMNLVGAVLIMISAAAFAVVKWLATAASKCKCECNDADVEQQGGRCGCNGGHSHDDCTHDNDSPPSSTMSSPQDPRHAKIAASSACPDTKPLLLLSDADEWGADYIRKGYSACGGDETVKMGGCAVLGGCADGCGCKDCDPKVPFLTATPSDLVNHHHHHQHDHKKCNHNHNT